MPTRWLLWAILALLGAFESKAAQPVSRPDTIYVNGKVVTLDARSSIAQAFAVRGQRIVAVGRNATIAALAGAGTRKVNLRGATVIPGLTDSHDHLWNSAKYITRGVDMVGVVTLKEMQDRLRAALVRSGGEVVFTTTGWSIRPAPTRKDLDAVSSTVPIVLIARRRGVGVLNSAALVRLGISREHPMFMEARVPVDDSGEPLGTPPAYPISVYMIDALLPTMTHDQQDEMVRQAMQERNALGITSIRELAVWPEAVTALQRIRNKGELTVRMALGIEFPDLTNTAAHLAELPRVNRSDPWLFLDSVSEEPWTPGSTSVEEFTALVRAENRMGWRHAPHVSSDESRGISADDATEQTLSAYETADRDSPMDGERWYLEHVPFATPEQMERMARLGLVISTQDSGYRPLATSPLPPQRMERQNPIREFLDHKLVVVGGSDYAGPTATEREPNNPMIPFYFYVTRKTQGGEVRTSSERISREEALRIFTVNAAYATFEEREKGQIAPGMLADFVILNQDLMSAPEEKILDTHPLATFAGGKKVYSAPGYR